MRNNDHSQHPRGQQNRRGPGHGGQRGHQQQQQGRRPNLQQGGQQYFNPEQNWGARGYGGGGGDQGVEDWDRRDEEMDRGQYTAPLGHGDDTDWHDDDAFGGEFIGDEPNRFGGQGGMAGAGYGTHGGGAHGGQWGAQGSRGGYGGQGMGGPGSSYGQGSGMNQGPGRDPGMGQGFGQRQGGSIGGPASGGMGWRGEPGWQGHQTRQWEQQQGQRFERGPKGYKRSDDRIKEDVSDRISQLQHVDSSDVEVDVKDGEVTLTGTVPNRVMKWQLENLVEAIGGVTDVNNMLRIRREGGFMQQARSTAQSVVNALKPNEENEAPSARRGGTPGSQDTGPVTNKK